MSEDKRKNLEATLSSLSNEEKAWVINFLVQGLIVATASENKNPSPRRKAIAKKRYGEPTDAHLETLLAGEDAPMLPEGDYNWSDIIRANSGKTIKPIEKWL